MQLDALAQSLQDCNEWLKEVWLTRTMKIIYFVEVSFQCWRSLCKVKKDGPKLRSYSWFMNFNMVSRSRLTHFYSSIFFIEVLHNEELRLWFFKFSITEK